MLLPPDFHVPPRLAVVPLRNTVLFPGGMLSIRLGNPKTMAVMRSALEKQQGFVLAAQRDPDMADPGPNDLHRVGTVSAVARVIRDEGDTLEVVVLGVERAEVSCDQAVPHLACPLRRLQEIRITREEDRRTALARLRAAALPAIDRMPRHPVGMRALANGLGALSHCVDMLAANLTETLAEKQAFLEELDVAARLERVIPVLHAYTREHPPLRLSARIRRALWNLRHPFE